MINKKKLRHTIKIIYYISNQENEDIVCKFKIIVAHEGALIKSHPNHIGYSYNVMVEWETGATNTDHLSIIAVDDPVTWALYTDEKFCYNRI